jgi:hypothetical protein
MCLWTLAIKRIENDDFAAMWSDFHAVAKKA